MNASLRRRVRVALTLLILLAGVTAASAAEPPKGNPPGRGVRTIILVRHGLYDPDDAQDPDVGLGLNEEGRAQAQATAQRFTNYPLHVDAIYTSTMTRARQTADIIAPALKLTAQRSRLIRECTPPTERADIMAREKPGEPEACRDTLELAWKRFFRPSPERDSTEVLVCHGNVIRWFTARAIGLEDAKWLRLGLGNCSLTTIRVRPDGTTQLLQYADVGHLSPKLQERLWFPAPPAAPARPDSARAR